jgi:hypothetical protein
MARALADRLGDEMAGVFGMDFRATSRAFLGWATTRLGDADGGDELTSEALALARRLGRPHDEAFALYISALCAVFRRDSAAAGARAHEGVALCAERGFGLFGAMATVIRGWAVAEEGDPDAGEALIEDGLAAFEASGAGMMLHLFLGLLGDARRRAGRPADALRAVEQGLADATTHGGFYVPELERLRAELLLTLRAAPSSAARRL